MCSTRGSPGSRPRSSAGIGRARRKCPWRNGAAGPSPSGWRRWWRGRCDASCERISMTPSAGPGERFDRHHRLLLGIAAFVIIAAGIRVAAELLNSILLAMLLTVTVVPAFDALRRRGVSSGLAVVLTSLLLAGVLVVLLGMLGLSGTRLIQVLPEYQ